MMIDLFKVQIMLDWLKQKLWLDSNASNAQRRTVKRGQVYRCNFGVGIGSEMQKERPCVIIQNDIANFRSPNVVVAPITHDTSTLPCMVPITTQSDTNGNVILDGQVNASNIVCVSKARLGNLVGVLSNTEMKNVDIAVAKSLDLMKYYAAIDQKLQDRLSYIEEVKIARNEAQDTIAAIRNELNAEKTDEDTLNAIRELLKDKS